MTFSFLKYLQPTHYFQLRRNNGTTIFPDPEKLPLEIYKQLELDNRFQTREGALADLSWQAIQKGFIGNIQPYEPSTSISIQDNYSFAHKYFHSAWVFYVLVLRLISLKNPFREIKGWMSGRKIKRSILIDQPIEYAGWEHFDSELILSAPKVSVIIPTLNRYEYLKDVLYDLEKQDYKNFETIVIDQSEPFNEGFYKGFDLELRFEYQEEKALWLARNKAIKKAKGSFLLFFDDDSRVKQDWISSHLKCLDFFNSDISSGVSISKIGDRVPKNYSFFRISDQLDTGNVMIRKEVFDKIGLYDRQFEKQRMGDGEFGLRAFKNGFLNISNPIASRLHLKVKSGGLREMGSWDAFRTDKIFAPRPIPSVLYFYRSYFGNRAALFAVLKTTPFSVIPYKFKKNKALRIIGAIVSVILLPWIVFQILLSWKMATKKMKAGPIIESIK